MDLNPRRQKIISKLESEMGPVTGSRLAKDNHVSRQVIVQDIALLKAQGVDIISTTEGYMIYKPNRETAKRVIAIRHNSEEIEDELRTIIEKGGKILDVIVTHPVYGEITVNLMLDNEKRLKVFIKKLEQSGFVPLLELTQGIHYHTIEAKDQETLEIIIAALDAKGYLLKSDN